MSLDRHLSAFHQILSQLTTRLRLYGANCNTTDLVLTAIEETKVNMTIWPAICEFGFTVRVTLKAHNACRYRLQRDSV